MDKTHVIVRKALLSDAKAIHALLIPWSAKEVLLPRSLTQIYTHIREFFVLCRESSGEAEQVLGCCALSIFWEDLAEIRSLVVHPEFCRLGYGRLLMNAVIAEARQFGLKRLFALTYQVVFFERIGFSEVAKDTLPQKVWSDCLNCPRFPNCNEIAVAMEL